MEGALPARNASEYSATLPLSGFGVNRRLFGSNICSVKTAICDFPIDSYSARTTTKAIMNHRTPHFKNVIT